MGVPSFFRWLERKYPYTVNLWKNIQCDNFYLDLNSIIHPCAHPEGASPPESEEGIMDAVGETIDHLVDLVRPKRLIYIAIDGVAPRAKMIQQRARRFRTAKLAKEKSDLIAHVLSTMKHKNTAIEKKSHHFDSNSITPGTLFMYKLSNYLENYIQSRKRDHTLWEKLTVILSNSNVPGEGEHKIIQFIRDQQKRSDYDPEIRHVMYGADADLIMLGLSTHENFFTIIRESFSTKKCVFCEICHQAGHTLNQCKGIPTKVTKKDNKTRVTYLSVQLDQLRHCLKKELVGGDFKRRINDWIFLCFFVGNDFLPGIQGLSIQNGAIDDLVTVYNDREMYLTSRSGKVRIHQIKRLMEILSRWDKYHVKRKLRHEFYKEKFHRNTKTFKTDVTNHYIKGLCWVFNYYFVGCPSWDWYYPYLYAPFTSDFKYATRDKCTFHTNTRPVTPFEQLMYTLPPSSANLLPKVMGDLMTTQLSEFYPKDFDIDLNGKKHEWQGVVLLPFIDSKRLKSALKGKDESLSPIEEKRNSEQDPILFSP